MHDVAVSLSRLSYSLMHVPLQSARYRDLYKPVSYPQIRRLYHSLCSKNSRTFNYMMTGPPRLWVYYTGYKRVERNVFSKNGLAGNFRNLPYADEPNHYSKEGLLERALERKIPSTSRMTIIAPRTCLTNP